MVSFSTFTVAAVMAFTASAGVVPTVLEPRGTCAFKMDCAHSTGGGGPGQAPLDNVNCGEHVDSPSGKSLIHNTDDLQAGHDPIVFKAADWKGAADVKMAIAYDRAGNHFTTCNAIFQGKTIKGTVKDKISTGTVSVSTTTCTFGLPCNA